MPRRKTRRVMPDVNMKSNPIVKSKSKSNSNKKKTKRKKSKRLTSKCKKYGVKLTYNPVRDCGSIGGRKYRGGGSGCGCRK